MEATPTLDPEIAEILRSRPPSAIDVANLQDTRNERAQQAKQLERSGLVDGRDYLVPGKGTEPELTVRVHRPKNLSGPLPCIYWIHGGGYVVGNAEMEDLRLERLCLSLGCMGVAVDYRLAPETPYPGPLEDCYAGLEWTYEEAEELGIDRDRIGIGGASAGGGLAAALALLVRDRAEIPACFQLLIYPMLDDRMKSESSRWDVPVWPAASNRFGWDAYLSGLAGQEPPGYAVPARAAELSDLPPAFILVGTLDILLDEDLEYARRLVQAGVPTELHVYPGAPHGFDNVTWPASRLGVQAQRAIEDWLRAQMGG